MIILAELGEAESALLLQGAWKAVLQTLRVVVIDLCDNIERQQVLNDILILRRHANQDHVDSLCAYGTQKLHDCNKEHGDTSIPAARAVQSKFHHVYRLFNLTLDGQVQNDGAKVAGNEDPETDLQQLIFLDFSDFAWVCLFIVFLLMRKDAGQT